MLDKKTPSKQKAKDIFYYMSNIEDSLKMKLWIKTLLSVHCNLPEIIKSVDKIIEINASSLSFISDIYNTEKSTYSQVEKVIDLTERKNKLLNLFIISKSLLSCLNEDDRLFLKRKFIFNWTAEDLSIEYHISIRTVFRRTEKLIDLIYEKIKKNNWSTKFIDMQVKDETWLLEKFYHFAKDNLTHLNYNISNNNNSQTLNLYTHNHLSKTDLQKNESMFNKFENSKDDYEMELQ